MYLREGSSSQISCAGGPCGTGKLEEVRDCIECLGLLVFKRHYNISMSDLGDNWNGKLVTAVNRPHATRHLFIECINYDAEPKYCDG